MSSIVVVLILLLSMPATAQHGGGVRGTGAPPSTENDPAILPGVAAWQREMEVQGWLFRGQATFVEQGHPAFRSPYRGANSLQPAGMQRNTFSTDLVIGRRLWEGAEIIADPQISRGFGLSGTRGVAAFPNGEAFRVGTEAPSIYLTRLFVRQTIGLSVDMVEDDSPLRFAAPVPRERITLTAGKIAVFDFFDDNRYAHDPRTQFLNWAFTSAGAFDFANDAKGYTVGAVAEWENGEWGLRFGAVQVAKRINSLFLDPQPFKGFQIIGQLDRFYSLGERAGAVRILGGVSRTRSQSYGGLIGGDITETEINPAGRYYAKGMAILNLEQEITEHVGLFSRLSWNNGRTQQWMYTEMDWAISAGLSLNGAPWGRAGDTVGLAGNVGGLSGPHRRFLAAGGLGFILGDGRITYRPETVIEAYYAATVAAGTVVTGDVQFIANPAHNADRGPVAVFSIRLHTEF